MGLLGFVNAKCLLRLQLQAWTGAYASGWQVTHLCKRPHVIAVSMETDLSRETWHFQDLSGDLSLLLCPSVCTD